jgi:hypothetical protein
MQGRYDGKVTGGKLLRVRVDIESGVVARASVNGDFFAHPEDAFERAEASLTGIKSDGLRDAAERAFSVPGLTLYGASAQDVACALDAAARDAISRQGGRL